MKRPAILLLAAMMIAAGCTKDDNTNPANNANIGSSNSNGNNNGGSGNNTYNQVSQNVKNNVKASYSIDNTRYRYKINITSTLASVYPNKTITCQVEGGYGDYYWVFDKTTLSSAQFYIGWCYPLRYNLNSAEESFLLSNGITTSNYAYMQVYLAELNICLDKQESGQTLKNDELDKLNTCRDGLKKLGITKLKNLLNVRVCVVIDGEKYIVGQIL